MAGLADLAAAEMAAEGEKARLESGPPATGLVPLLHAVDSARGAILATLVGDHARATLCLHEASIAADAAFQPGTREAYALAIVLGAITEAAAS